MDSLKALMILISNNYMTILILVIMGLGIYSKIRDFLSKSKEEQKAILKAKMTEESVTLMGLVQKGILDFVVEAEKKFGEKTGKLKSSSVYNMIIEKYPKIIDYINEGYITREYIEDCIDDGVELMNSLIDSNEYVKAIIKPTTTVTNVEPVLETNQVSPVEYSDITDIDDYSFDGDTEEE